MPLRSAFVASIALLPLRAHSLAPSCHPRHRRFFKMSAPSTMPAHSLTLPLPSLASTAALGAALGASRLPGDAILLNGPLGSGKTSLARGYIRAAALDAQLDVTSPTYCLDSIYYTPAGLEVHHMDLWRLKDVSERSFVDFGWLFREGIAVIEWADRLGGLVPDERCDVFLEFGEENEKEREGGEDDWGFSEDDGVEGGVGRVARVVGYGEKWVTRLKGMSLEGLEDASSAV